MTSKTSYNNIGQYMMQQLRATRSFILLLGVIYLTIGPVMLGLQMISLRHHVNPLPVLSMLFNGYYLSYFFAAIALGTLGVFYITRYQNVQRQSNFYHSLPVTRGNLLTGRVLALVVVQVFLLVVVTVAVMVASFIFARDIGDTSIIKPLMMSAGIHFVEIMMIFLLAMAIALFAGQLTASTIGQILMTVVLHMTTIVFAGVSILLLEPFTETYFGGGLSARLACFNILSPIMNAAEVNNGFETGNPLLLDNSLASHLHPEALLWSMATTVTIVVLTVALMAGTYWLYQRRDVEKAGDTLMFTKVGSAIKAIYVFCGSMCGGFAFYSISDRSIIAFTFGALIAGVVVHLIAEMIYSQDVNGIRHHFASTVIPLGLAVVVAVAFHTGMVSYDAHLPREGSVKAAYLNLSDANNDSIGLDTEAAQDPDTIKKVLHAMALASEKRLTNHEMLESHTPYESGVTSLMVHYETTLGGHTIRTYNLKSADAAKIIAPFLADKTYYQTNLSGLAGATIESIAEFSLNSSGFDTFSATDNTLYLIENGGSEALANMSKKEREERLERTEALLKVIQSDLKHRNADVLQSRPIAYVNYAVPVTDRNGRTVMSWGNRVTIFEGDKATNALLKEWREAGILPQERAQLLEALDGFRVVPVTFDSKGVHETGTMSKEAFVDAWLNGELMYRDQATRYGFDVDRNVGMIVVDETIDEENLPEGETRNIGTKSYASFCYVDKNRA